MKITHVISGYLPESSGGTQLQLRELCLAQRQSGHEVSIFTRIDGDDHPELSVSHATHEDIPIARLTNNFLDLDRFELLYTHPVIDRRFEEFLAGEQPDVVHIHHLTCLSTTMIEVAKRCGLPVVMWVSDYWLQCLRGQRLHPDDFSICEELDRSRCVDCLRPLWPHLLAGGKRFGIFGRDAGLAALEAWERHVVRMLELCDATLAPSAFHRDRFVEFGMPAERSHVVTYGLPRDELEAPPRGDRTIRAVGFTGMVLPSKGVHTLIEAFNRVGRQELELHIHGEVLPFHGQSDYGEQLRAAVQPGLRVQFHGGYESSQLPSILASLDLLVAPSLWWESYCLTAREGALAGLPVIVSDLAGLGEAAHEGLALGTRAGDVADLASAIERLCDDAALRDSLTRKADLVRSTADCARQIESIYTSVMAG